MMYHLGIHVNRVFIACPKNIFFNAGNSFSLFADVKICEKTVSH